MNKVASFVFAVLISGAGCQKSADLGRIQQETLASVKTFNNQLEIEQRRVDVLLTRGRQVAQAPGVGDAGKLLTQARASLEQLRAKAASAPQDLAAAAKQSREELDKTGDELLEQLDHGLALVKADLDAVDNWVSSSERGSAQTAMNQGGAQPTDAPAGGQAIEQTTPGQPNQGIPPAAIQGPAGQNAPAAPGTGNTPAAPMDAPKANAGAGAVPATSPSATGQPGAANTANPNKK